MTIKKTFIAIMIAFAVALTGCTAYIQNIISDDKADISDTENSGGSIFLPEDEQKNHNDPDMPGNDGDSEEDSHQGKKSEEEDSHGGDNPGGTDSETDSVLKQIQSMTLEEKIGQMVIVGIDGYDIDENTVAMIEKYHVGGFILFGHNIENQDQLLTLVNSLKSANSQKSKNKIPIFISVDEEGGRVSRMPAPLENFPPNKVIGEKNDSNLSYEIGKLLGEKVKAFGFNMNFAPVLDVNSNPQNPVIGDRSFGSDADIVAKLGVETMKIGRAHV